MVSGAIVERGPEAAATRARLLHTHALFQGEGATVLGSEDGDTFCVHQDERSLLDLGGPGDLDESERRNATSVLRFATPAERDTHVAAAPWQAHARRRGWAVLDERPQAPRFGGSFEFRIGAGMTASEMCVMVEATKAGVTAAWEIDVADRGHVEEDGVDLSTDAWARFQEELRILEASRWARYRPQALDGISWSMRWATVDVTEAAGHNAYPPYG